MSNHPDKTPEDRRVINPDEPWEITYWTQIFGCTEEELRKAVNEVGSSVTAVKKYFQR